MMEGMRVVKESTLGREPLPLRRKTLVLVTMLVASN
jgi:hypothetical protein